MSWSISVSVIKRIGFRDPHFLQSELIIYIMLAAVYSLVVVIEVLIFSQRVTPGSSEDLKLYTHSRHLLQNQENDKLTIIQVDKEISPNYSSHQYSCLRNGSLPCPPWSYCDSTDGIFKCPQIPTRALQCDGFDMGNALHILVSNCVTYNEELDLTEVGLCIYNSIHDMESTVNEVYHLLPPYTSDWNDDMCGRYNRTGTLCSRCNADDGFYPRAYSFDVTCTQCNGKSNWWKYVLSAYLPLTFFYFVILCFKVSFYSSHLQGYIIYSQIIAWPPFVRSVYLISSKPVSRLTKFLGSIYGIWNLDFFRTYNTGICLQTDNLTTTALDLTVAVYPLLLMALTYMLIGLHDSNYKLFVILGNPFRAFFSTFRRNWDIRTSTVDAFATFLILANMKCLIVCFDLLVPVKVYHFVTPELHVNYTWQLYYDATVPYFSAAHLPYAILAIAMLLIFVITPTLVIIAYPIKMCHKCFIILPHRSQIFLHTFMDSFQGCYKDGTEHGTRDCRWFSSLLLILRFILISMYAYILDSLYYPYAAMVLVITAMITIVADPFKTHLSHLSSIMAIFILFIAALYACALGLNMAEIKNNFVTSNVFQFLILLVAVLPLLYVLVLILLWVFSHMKFGLNFIKRVNAWRQGYKELI